MAGAPDTSDPLAGDAQALFAAIRAARVGGSFWSPPPALDGVTAVLAGVRTDAVAAGARPLVLGPDVDPWPILDSAVPLFVDGDHELAALARIAGRPCTVVRPGRFGSDAAVLRAILAETRYRDPFSDAPAGAAEAIALLGLWRRTIDANRGLAVACGVAWWKRQAIARFLWAPGRRLRFLRAPARAVAAARRAGGAVAIWPSKVHPALERRAQAAGVPLVRLEDGFVRSIGLGSALFPPFSIVVDTRGIYYDPARPSDLEALLADGAFDPALCARADALAAAIVAARISKYGPGEAAAALPARDPARRLVLVPGQVGDDLSVRTGGGAVAGNLDLLRRARAAAPDAEIWFRPHPDVDAGHRAGAVPDEQALAHADRVVRGGDVAALLDRVDAVHTLTSLMGFEALLRGLPVTVHGAPFYAGWGVTEDVGAVPARRGRRLPLAALAAATLILYPRYLDPVTGLPAPPEVVVRRFAEGLRPRETVLHRLRRWQGRVMAGWRG